MAEFITSLGLIPFLLICFFGGGGIITSFVMIAEYKKHRPVKAASCADYYKVDDETKMTAADDTFLRTHTTRVKVSSSTKKR
jgi:hypothetical protein